MVWGHELRTAVRTLNAPLVLYKFVPTATFNLLTVGGGMLMTVSGVIWILVGIVRHIVG